MPQIVRRVRELLVAGTTLGIAAAAHLAAGGTLPATAAGWVATLALMAPVVVWTARRRLTLPRLLPAMGLLQVVVHTVLTVVAAPAGAASTRPGPTPAGALPTGAHAGHLALEPGSLTPPTAGAAHLHHAGDTSASMLMLGAHAAAVLVTALLLAAGDRAAAAVLVWLDAVALLVAGPPAILVTGRPAGPPADTARVPRSWVARAGLRLRGPPPALAPA